MVGFAAMVGLLAWLLIASEITLIAGEVNVVLARKLWPGSLTGGTGRGGGAVRHRQPASRPKLVMQAQDGSATITARDCGGPHVV